MNFEGSVFIGFVMLLIAMSISSWIYAKKQMELKLKKEKLANNEIGEIIKKYRKKMKIAVVLFILFLFARVILIHLYSDTLNFVSEYVDALWYPLMILFSWCVIRYRTCLYLCEKWLKENIT